MFSLKRRKDLDFLFKIEKNTFIKGENIKLVYNLFLNKLLFYGSGFKLKRFYTLEEH